MSRVALTVSLHYKIQIRKTQHSNKHFYSTEKWHSHIKQNQKKSANSDTVSFWITELSKFREAHEKSE